MSLINFDWTWSHLGTSSGLEMAGYYTKMAKLFTNIGQNLPALGKGLHTHIFFVETLREGGGVKLPETLRNKLIL